MSGACGHCLGTFPLYENYTGQNLSEAVTDVLANWDLKPDQLVATTTDNGSKSRVVAC